MSHLPQIVSDLVLILITAGIVTIIFKFLKQPVVLGYIIAGFFISPHFGLLPTVTDMQNINTWAEIGIIFLLFALGLEFSFKKLVAVGGTAFIGTLINMGSMIAIGYIIGQLMGWTSMESLFLGGILSMSSTTIIIKAFNDMGLQKKKFANIVFGMLIVEDLAAILLMVLLSTVAVSQHFEGSELVGSMLKLLFFIVIWFVSGIFLIPTFLKKFKKYLNNETLLIISVGLCLGMVLFASSVGFSSALGAFIMGSILAETLEEKRIEHLIEPLKNLFGAVFFVSVGMMIVPETLVEYAIPILILTLVVLVGRVIFATLGVVASGEGLKVSLQAGFSLAQIGEFSFIIATLGMQLGVISDFIYPIVVAVSVITTFTTPYFIKAANPVYNTFEKIIPPKWNKLIAGYAANTHKTINRQTDWNILLKKVLLSACIYFILALAVYFLSRKFFTPFIIDHIHGIWGHIVAALLSIILMAPFMVAIMRKNSKTTETKRLWEDSHFNKVALIGLNLLCFVLCVVLIMMVLVPLFSQATGILTIIAIVLAIILIFSKGFGKQSKRIEERFLENLHSKEVAEESKQVVNKEARSQLMSQNIHLEEIDVPHNSTHIGKTLGELNFKQSSGVDVVSIIRGDETINIPNGNVMLFPFDKLIVAGTDDELQKLITVLEQKDSISQSLPQISSQIDIMEFELEQGCMLIGKAVKETCIREKADCMIILLERNSEEVINLTADTILQEGDVLWLAGEKKKLSKFSDNLNL